jgi:hypothetical protein
MDVLHQMPEQVASVKTHPPDVVPLRVIRTEDVVTHIVVEAEGIRGAGAHHEDRAADRTPVAAAHLHADAVAVAAEAEAEVMDGREAHPVAEEEQAAADDQEAEVTTATAVALTREALAEIVVAEGAESGQRIRDKSFLTEMFRLTG